MRVLFVTTAVPYPPDTGGKLRTYHLLRHLSKRHDITLVVLDSEGTAHYDPVGDICKRVVSVARTGNSHGRLGALGELLIAPVRRGPVIATRYSSEALVRTIERLFGSGDYDLVHCDSVSVAGSVTAAIGNPHCMGTHNVEAQIWARYASVERHPLKKAYILNQLDKVRRYERENYRRFSHCLVVSEDDGLLLGKWYGIDRVSIVPNGVDVEHFRPVEHPPVSPNVAFVGSMDWRPNQDAVLFFFKEIWPLIKRKKPKATFTVVGRKPPVSISGLCDLDQNVRVTGGVDDVVPFLWEASVSVVPLRVGGGSRIKILESLAACRPVVTTNVGVEGLNGIRQWVRVADEPQSFAECVIEVLQDPKGSMSGRLAARDFVVQNYSWSAVAELADQAWDISRHT